jgi:hypothetical protein
MRDVDLLNCTSMTLISQCMPCGLRLVCGPCLRRMHLFEIEFAACVCVYPSFIIVWSFTIRSGLIVDLYLICIMLPLFTHNHPLRFVLLDYFLNHYDSYVHHVKWLCY